MPADSTILTGLNGKWFNIIATTNFKVPNNYTAEVGIDYWFHLEKLGTNFALYKVLQVIDKCNLKKIPNASISVLNYKNKYSVNLCGAVLSYNPRMDAYDLKLVDFDDTTEVNYQYDYENNKINGSAFENSLPKEKSGFVAYQETIGNVVPKCFENVDFMRLYKRIYCQQTKAE